MNDIPIESDLMPANARKLATVAHEHGWSVRCTYAEYPDKADQVASSIAVRLRRESAVWAIWIDGRFDSAAIGRPLGPLKYRDLKTIITKEPPNDQ